MNSIVNIGFGPSVRFNGGGGYAAPAKSYWSRGRGTNVVRRKFLEQLKNRRGAKR